MLQKMADINKKEITFNLSDADLDTTNETPLLSESGKVSRPSKIR